METRYVPSPAAARDKNYVTYRRLWLDSMLEAFSHEMRGVVADVGGKRGNKRGVFKPPEEYAKAWWYLNLDISTRPSVCGDVQRIPLRGQSVDCILCTEVLEHLPHPERCVDEMRRLLRDGGLVFASTPFLYPVHADPYDFQRFTEDGLRHLFRKFKTVEVYRMGGYMGVLGLLVELGIMGVEGNSPKPKFLRWAMKWVSRWLFRADLLAFGRESQWRQRFTTGYFVRAVR